jgi:hypothetical protein
MLDVSSFSLYFLDAESLGKCQRLLDRGISPYAQLLATTTITKLVSRATQILTLQQRIDIRSGHTSALNHRRERLRDNQGCGFGSIGSGFNRISGSGSGFRRAKMTHKVEKFINFMF